MLKLLFFISCLVGISLCKQCPDISVYPHLEPTKYFGAWYEIERFFDPFEADLKCVIANYGPLSNGKISVNNTGVDLISGKFKFRSAEAYAPDANNAAKLIIQFTFGSYTTETPYWVIDTDYSNYALVYTCQEVLDVKLDFAWILSRKPTLDSSTVNRLKTILDKNEISSKRFETIDQSC